MKGATVQIVSAPFNRFSIFDARDFGKYIPGRKLDLPEETTEDTK